MVVELRHLESFLRIVELGSQAAAASSLGRAPSTVTLHVQELEHELGAPLFARSQRRLVLTPTGEILQRHARAIVRSVESIAAECATDAPAQRGTIRVGCVEPAAHRRLLPLLARSYATRPGVRVEVTTGGSATLHRLVDGGHVELAICTAPIGMPGLAFEPCYEEPLGLAVDADHPLATKRTVSLADLAPYGLVVTEPGCAYRHAILSAFERLGVVPVVRGEIGSAPSIVAAARHGLGVGLAPLRWLDDADGVVVRPLAGLVVTVGIVTSARASSPSTLVAELREQLRREAPEWGTAPPPDAGSTLRR